MEKANTRILKIHYNDGSDMQVEYVQQEEVSNIATRIEEAIESNEILIELEDRLLVIPLNNIKYIEIAPAPSRLPKFAIRNARLT